MALRIATRGSTLALTQARLVAELLGGAELVEVSSDGEPGDKSRFVHGVERALLAGEAEIGVHSAKDLPAEMAEGLVIAAVPPREDPADVWIGEGSSLDEVPEGARVGTASLRRRAQLLAARPDLRVEELHGNVDTRLRKLAEGDLDAIVLAAAGLRRLGREGEIGVRAPRRRRWFRPPAKERWRCRSASGDEASAAAAAASATRRALRELTAERAAVAPLEASCATPIGVHARTEGERLAIDAFVGLPDGTEWLRDRDRGRRRATPAAPARALAERLLAAGARDLLERRRRRCAVSARAGVVYLVGAGPGDPGLMTARSLELIATADVVFYDRLIPPGRSSGAREDAELVYVGKQPGQPSVAAGGDRARGWSRRRRPGAASSASRAATRSSSAAAARRREALREAGVEFEVVPGVTAGVAATAYAGIPVTHRDDASAVAFVTGHEDPAKAESALDWEALAALPRHPCLLHGGANGWRENAAALIAAGRDPEEPAAAIERGTMPGSAPSSATLGTIAEAVEREGSRRRR